MLGQLRDALSEHIGLARQSLKAQISALSTLQAKTKDIETKARTSKSRKERAISPENPEDGGSESLNAA